MKPDYRARKWHRIRLKANEFYARGEYEEALRYFQHLVDQNPEDVNALLRIANCHEKMERKREFLIALRRLAQVYMQQERLNLAVATLRRAERAAPEDIRVKEFLGLCLLKQKNALDARRVFLDLADLYAREERLIKLIDALQRALEAFPEDLDVRRRLADAEMKLGRKEDALQDFLEVLRGYFHRGEVARVASTLEFLEEQFTADEIRNALAALHDGGGVRDYLQGVVALRSGDLDTARSVVARLMENTGERPEFFAPVVEMFAESLWDLIRPRVLEELSARLNSKAWEEARDLLAPALKHQPADPDLQAGLLTLARECPDKTHAVTLVEQTVYALQQSRAHQAALDLLDRLVEIDPDFEPYARERSKIVSDMEAMPTVRFDLAVSAGLISTGGMPAPGAVPTPEEAAFSFEVQLDKSEECLQEGDLDRALRLVERVLDAAPPAEYRDRALELQGRIHRRRGNVEQAVQSLLEAARCAHERGDSGRLTEIAREIEATAPGDPRVELLRQGDFESVFSAAPAAGTLEEAPGERIPEAPETAEPEAVVAGEAEVPESVSFADLTEDDFLEISFDFDTSETREEEVLTTIQQFQAYAAAGKMEDYQAQLDLGIMYYGLGLVGEAIPPLLKALSGPHTQARAALYLARAHLKREQPEAAVNYFVQAVESAGEDEDLLCAALYELGRLHESRDEFEQAYHVFRRLVSIRPEYKDARIHLQSLSPEALPFGEEFELPESE